MIRSEKTQYFFDYRNASRCAKMFREYQPKFDGGMGTKGDFGEIIDFFKDKSESGLKGGIQMAKKINNSKLTKKNTSDNANFYLTLCKCTMNYTCTRWAIVAFFMGISFVIFGFSFVFNQTKIPILVMQLTSLIIYWFSFILFLRLNQTAKFMRNYLIGMEESKKFNINFQTSYQEYIRMKSKLPPVSWFLFWFGIFYSLAVLFISLLFNWET